MDKPDGGSRGKRRYSRRQFFIGAGVGAAGAAGAMVALGLPTATSPPTGPLAQITPAGTAGQGPPVVRVGPRPGPAGTILTQLTVNGTVYEAAVDPRWTLADLLRDQLGLTGTKVGCDRGECGSCTVLVDGRSVLACLTLAAEVDGHQVVTVEGLASGGRRPAADDRRPTTDDRRPASLIPVPQPARPNSRPLLLPPITITRHSVPHPPSSVVGRPSSVVGRRSSIVGRPSSVVRPQYCRAASWPKPMLVQEPKKER